MTLFKEKSDLNKKIGYIKEKNLTIGLVPTMGALHKGHLSLVERSLVENDFTIVSVFINPTQFNDKEDLANYPKNLTKDCDFLESISDDIIIFAPDISDVYDKNISVKKFDFQGLDRFMEGKYRKGHFEGVATVVSRLFEIVKPNKAYFGEKDYQQLKIIQQLVVQYRIPVNIIGCKIIREDDGLALSSRNSKLGSHSRNIASKIFELLNYCRVHFDSMNLDEIINHVNIFFEKISEIELEYFIIADSETLIPAKEIIKDKQYRAFVAVRLDGVRLIDNIELN
ncbi:MAG: pantoate--beta-alanine ligase [Bacteroidota bacterium]|nr:pantoate--beta-alanine ligase [Bacteroidota bacterium]